MCDFISWIETEREGKKILCYLTDYEVFSARGKEIFNRQETRDNDVLGHGAIRAFFNLRRQGTEYEKIDFWEYDTLPQELAEKIKDFDKHWGRIFSSGIFMNDDLRYIICYAPNLWKKKASEQLLKQKPSNDDLNLVICHAPTPWKKKAWRQLLKQKPSNDDLRHIICYAPNLWKKKAKELLSEYTA